MGPDHIYAFDGQSVRPLSLGVSKLVEEAVFPGEIHLTYLPNDRLLVMAYGRTNLLCLCLGGERPAAVTWDIRARTIARNQETLVAGDADTGEVVSFDPRMGATVPVTVRWKSTPLSLGDASLWKLVRRVEASFTTGGSPTPIRLGVQEGLGDGTPLFEQATTLTGNEGSVAVTVPANVQGRYATVSVEATTTQMGQPLLAPPIYVEFRARDRLGRR